MTNEEKIALASAYKACFNTNDGKKVIEDLSRYCYENRNTFVEGNHDKQNVNNGKRAVILYIRSKLNFNALDEVQTQAKTKENDYE